MTVDPAAVGGTGEAAIAAPAEQDDFPAGTRFAGAS
jgi:hypothetical protein